MKTFKEAWAETGYQYGHDSLENVELGWNMAIAAITEMFQDINLDIVEAHEEQLNRTDLYIEEYRSTAIGMQSLVGIMGSDYPKSYGNYFSLWGGPRIVNFWAENLSEANRAFKLNGEVKIRRYYGGSNEGDWAIIIDKRIPKEWYNKGLCFTGGYPASVEIIKDMYDVLGLDPEGLEQYTDPVSYYAKQGHGYNPKTGIVTMSSLVNSKTRTLSQEYTIEPMQEMEHHLNFK